MQIYIHRNNQQLGPFTETEIAAQLASGAISLQDHVWWQGQTGWVTLAESPLAANLSAATSVPAPMASPMPGMPADPVHPTMAPRTSALAIWALVCGCLSLFCSLFTAIPAIILGHMGMAATKRDPALGGRGLAMAGMIIGYVITTLTVAYLIFVVTMFGALQGQVKEVFKTIDSQLKAAEAATNSDTTPASPDAATNSTPDTTTNAPAESPPATTTSPDSSTTNAPATTPPDQSTNAPAANTNSPTTNAAPVNQ